MSDIQFNKRFIRALPGRVRVEIFGLKSSVQVKQQVNEALGRLEGIRKVSACTDTGRALIEFSPGLSFKKIMDEIQFIESQIIKQKLNMNQNVEVDQEVAATTSTPENDSYEYFQSIPHVTEEKSPPTYALPLAISLGGLAVLGINA